MQKLRLIINYTVNIEDFNAEEIFEYLREFGDIEVLDIEVIQEETNETD